MRIALLHYGEQLKITFDYLSKPPVPEIEGLVLLSASDQSSSAEVPVLKIPVFDIVGQFDYDLVKHEMAARQKKLSRDKTNYLALEIPGAQHDYGYSRQLLSSFIHGCLLKLPQFQPKPPPVMYSYLYPIAASFANHLAQMKKSDWRNDFEHPLEIDATDTA
ncbi:MAG: hypothetical protein ACRCXC_07430 [Legionella sp.]